jgi:hypothetical protein
MTLNPLAEVEFLKCFHQWTRQKLTLSLFVNPFVIVTTRGTALQLERRSANLLISGSSDDLACGGNLDRG